MLHFIKLTRPVNLLVIVLTMYILHGHYLTMTPHGLTKELFFEFHFALLVISTVFIAAAGNIINDYFDVKIDRINKPEKLIVDKYIKKRVAILFHSVLNVTAVLIALLMFFAHGFYWAILFHLFTTFHLYLYSMMLKRKFLSGNIVISVLAAMVPILVYLYDMDVYSFAGNSEHEQAFHLMAYFALFAFCTTLIREIQKDFADMKGDAFYGCKTVPILLGLRKGRIILFSIFSFTILTFIVLFVLKARINPVNISFFVAVILLMSFSLFLSFKAIKRKQWNSASFIMKLVMIVALIFFGYKLFYAG